MAAKESEERIEIDVVIKGQCGDLCSDEIGVYLTVVVDTQSYHIKLYRTKYIHTHTNEYK